MKKIDDHSAPSVDKSTILEDDLHDYEEDFEEYESENDEDNPKDDPELIVKLMEEIQNGQRVLL